jgi:hypothetical protein
MKKPVDRWKAIRRGAIYCAPACGGGCTWHEYELAVERADILCKHMGSGWTPRVWEKLGWHYETISPCGRIKVSPSEGNKPLRNAIAFLGEPGSPGGRWACHGKTPKQAMTAVIASAKADLAKIDAQIQGL